MIVLLNAAINVAILVPAVLDVMKPGYGDTRSLSGDVFAAAASVAGVPFTLLAVWGVFNKDERFLRAYYFYLIIASVIGICFLIGSAATKNCANSLPRELMRGGAHGGSLFCTIFNVGSKLLVLALASVLAYFTFIIWSLDAKFFFETNWLKDWAPIFGQTDLESAATGCCGVVAGVCGCGTCCAPNTTCGECGACLCGPGTMCGDCFAPASFCGSCCIGFAKCGDIDGSCESCCGGCGDECGSFCARCGCEMCDCCSSKAERMPFAAAGYTSKPSPLAMSDAVPYSPNAKTIFGAPSYPHVISYPNLETIRREKSWAVPQMSMV